MPHPTLTILLVLDEIAKEKQTGPVACHCCNNKDNTIKYGTYKRYDFSGREQIKIQRYFCKHDGCRRTFSILPHPFLRITRLTLCMITALIRLVDRQHTTAEICRRLGLTRSVVDGAIEKWHGLLDWIDQEVRADPAWAPSPCIDPPGHWSDFIRMFAMKFYPKRYGYV